MSRAIRMICQAAAIVVGLVLTSSALAAPRKVLVLPLEGDADPDARAKYSAQVQQLAHKLPGKVTVGDVAFTDTATAIGCDPKVPKCAEDVRATLGVEELIYGTATKEDGKTVIVVHRIAKGKPPREAQATLEATDPPERAESELTPLFRPPAGDPGHKPVGPDALDRDKERDKEEPVPEGPSTPTSRTKVLAYAAVGVGGTLLLISFALWSSAGGLKDEIAAHPVNDSGDFIDLVALEDKARTRALTGNALFLVGLAVGGVGGWILYREHKAQHTTVAPAPVPGGAALMLGGVF